jgi:hypothetical protein
MEEWRDVVGYEGLYEVSNYGGVRRVDNGADLRGNLNSYGYRVVKLSKDGKGKDFKLHQLVARAFIPNDFGARIINHKDGNRDNNYVDNLEWCSRKQNAQHAIEVLGITTMARPIMQIGLDGELLAIWANANKAATTLGFGHMMISACCKGTAQTAYDFMWQYVDVDFRQMAKAAKRMAIEQKIERLSQELETLERELA